MARMTTVEFPVFSDFIIHVEISNDFDKTISKYPCIGFAKGDNHRADAVTIHDGTNIIFVFLKHNVSVGTIAHESWHALSHMFDMLGMDKEGEAVAYHLGYLVNKIFRFARGKK